MAPLYGHSNPTITENVTYVDPSATSTITEFGFRNPFLQTVDRYCHSNSFVSSTKVETKKERIKRIAKEKMYASWKTYNDRTVTIKEIKQICKPMHKINHSGRRF